MPSTDLRRYDEEFPCSCKENLCRSYSKAQRCHVPRKCADIIYKTLYDPAETISKRRQRRLRSASASGFQFDVPYSLNKHERWDNVNPKSLLLEHENEFETAVVEDALSAHAPFNYIVRSVHVLENEAIATISTSGKPKKLAHCDSALQGWKENNYNSDRILYIVQQNLEIARHSKKRRKTKRKTLTSLTCLNEDTDVQETFWTSDSDMELTEAESPHCSDITLGDFIPSSASESGAFEILPRRAKEFPASDNKKHMKRRTFPKLVDIAADSRRKCIFEIVDVSLQQWQPFNLRQKVTELVPTLPQNAYGPCFIKWFSPWRVCISNQPTSQNIFAIFFELRNNLQKLRVRVNTNTRYPPYAGRNALIHMIKRMRDFDTLFNNLMDFIWKTWKWATSDENSRIMEKFENFLPAVNSSLIAVIALRCEVYDQLKFINKLYFQNPTFGGVDPRMEYNGDPCTSCQSTQNDDLFPTKLGPICRDCLVPIILHQLRLKYFPIEIPLITVKECSPWELLYAVLPVRVMSALIEMSFQYFYAEEHPEAMFTRCPACASSLVIDTPKRVFGCACPRCRCYFCHYCHSEPHWPMSCKEFKIWREIWDEQYVVEKLCPANDEKVLRIKCNCGQVLHACESLAHGTYCPNHCGHRFDKVGLMRNQHDLFRCLTPRERQLVILRDGEIVKKGIPVSTTPVELKRRVRRKYAFVCAEARSLRFDAAVRNDLRKSLRKYFSCRDRRKILDLWTAALFLVENCAAWLYLHRNYSALRHLMSDVLKLLNLVQIIERNIKLKNCYLLTLEKEVFDLISDFQTAKSVQEEEEPALGD